MSQERCFVAGSNDEGRRLDRLIRKMFPQANLGWIYRSIRRGDIRLNQQRAAIHSRVMPGDRITVRLVSPFSDPLPPREGGSGAGLPPALIVFENRHILALNKPAGMLTHGPDSLEERVTAYAPPSREASLSFRPGPLQRLDRNTTGLILFSRSLAGARRVSALLRARKVSKVYLALLDGVLTSPRLWRDRLIRDGAAGVSRIAPAGPEEQADGREARTEVTPLAHSDSATLAACRLVTGRTHQIRAQAARHGHPLAGDRKYGGSRQKGGYVLHALLIRLEEGESELGFRSLWAPPPELSRRRIDALIGRGATAAALSAIAEREKV